MTSNSSIVNNTTPGLGASDLASLIGATYVGGFGALAGTTQPGKLPILRRALRKLGTLRLRDLGLKRHAG